MLSFLLIVASSAPTTLRIAASGDLVGQLAPSTCDDEHEAPLVRLSAQLGGAPADAVKIDAGDFIGTAVIARMAIERDPDGLAETIASLGYKGLALGHRDLAAPRPQLLTIARALAARGLDYTLSNLACDEDARALCDVIINADDPPALFDTAAGKVAFLAAVAPSAFEHAAKDRTRGMTLLDPAQAIAESTRRARENGADWVIAVYDPKFPGELEDAIGLALKIDPAASPDVLLVQGISDRVRSASSAIGNTTLVATRWDAVVAVELARGDDPKLATTERAAPAPAATALATSLNRALCGEHSAPYPGGKLSAPLDRDAFAAFFLDVLREHSLSEVAVINRLAVSRRAPYPFTDSLTPLALMQALPFENELRRTIVRGDALKALLEGPSIVDLYVRGAEKRESGWYIAGRALDLRADYRVVTTDYVAEGGALGALKFTALGHETTRAILGQFLMTPREGDCTRAPIDPAERTRWTLSYRLQLDVASVTVANPDPTIFTDTQLARGQALSIVGETEFRAFGDHPSFTFENQLRLRYGLLSTVTPAGVSSGFVDNVDLVAARSLFFYRRLFARRPAWYHPLPFADVYLESELTKPAARPYHHLMLQPTAGLRWELAQPFAIYVGGGFTWETMAKASDLVPPSSPIAFVLVAGWQLRPFKLVQLGERAVEVETNLDAFIRDLGANTQATLRGRVRLVIPVFSIFSLTTTYDLFLRVVQLPDAAGSIVRRVGYSGDIYLGVQVSYGQALQAFRL